MRGWFDGIEMIKNDPNGSYEVVGKALKLDNETVSGMLSGLKLTPYADNAQFYGLTGAKAHYETLFDTAFVIWRKKGLVTKPVDAKDWADTRFLQAVAVELSGAEGGRSEGRREGAVDERRADHQQADPDSLHAGIRRDHAGLVLVARLAGRDDDVVRQHLLRVEGNTDAPVRASANLTLSERRAHAVKNYIVKNFPNIPPTRFQTIGRGSANPVAPNTTEAGRQLNRRTDIKVILATN